MALNLCLCCRIFPAVMPLVALDFAHFANGGLITSDLVLVNAGSDPIRPAIYFHDQEGELIAAPSTQYVPGNMEIRDDDALSPGRP